jgi:small-conductance mechanosensitive channel
MSFRFAFILLWTSSLLAATVPAASAQQAEDAAAGAKAKEQTKPAPPTSVPLSDVPTASRTTEERLRSIAAQLSADAAVERVVQEQEAERAALGDAHERLSELLQAGPSRERMTDAEIGWQRRAKRLANRQAVLSTRASELGQAIAYLREHRALWQHTREIASESGASKGLIRVIDDVLGSLEKLRKDANPRLDAVLRIQKELDEDEAAIAQALERLDVAQSEYRSRLFERELPPLWTTEHDDPAIHLSTARESVLNEAVAIREFAAQRTTEIFLLGLLGLLSIYFAYGLRKSVRNATEHAPELASTISIFERPISLAIFVTVVGFLILDQSAPKPVRDLLLTVLVVPALRILPSLVHRAFRPLLYGIATIFVVTQVRTLIDQAAHAHRLFFLLEILGVIAFLIWIRRPARLAQLEPEQRVHPLLPGLLKAALGILCLAFVTAVFGFQSFAELLGNGTLRASYAAVLLFGALASAEAIFRIALDSHLLNKLRSVRRRRREIIRWSFGLLRLLAILTWVRVTLGAFSIQTVAFDYLGAILGASASIGALSISLGDVLSFAITLFAAWVFARIVRFFLEEEIFTRISMKRGAPNAIATLLHYTLLTLGFLLALGAAGMDFSRVTLLAGAFGIGVGFGLQNIVNNFVSGLILLFERPIQTGDTVEVGGVLGDVKRIGIRSSTIRTVTGAEVLVPNANLVSDQVTNWTLSDRRRRIEIDVGVIYGTEGEQVIKLLLDVAHENDKVLTDPEPLALFMGFGDSSLDFRLRAWVSDFNLGMQVRSDLAVAIQRALKEAEIEVPFPQRDLHLRSVEPEVERILRPGDDDR